MTKKKTTFTVSIEIYTDRAKQFRWRLKASNGRILADSGESYTRRSRCQHAAIRLIALVNVLDLKSVTVTRVGK